MNRNDKASVGIFWIDCKETGKIRIFADCVLLKDSELYCNHRVHSLGHFQLWASVQKRNLKWIGVEYESIPRGRVVWSEGVFFVYANRIAEGKRIQKKILETFGIKTQKTKFNFSDEHYEIHKF
ncbi:MAG TPA: hypothetical protein DET40_25120 [Lentisphaeria bacterium]|nr:MAG: hypothetical protein A2X45_18840 [Lentisphaerae bacterium GWF2_50_93]HCE46842.1 hypothetical protein [Lentisphaeria bacterium]